MSSSTFYHLSCFQIQPVLGLSVVLQSLLWFVRSAFPPLQLVWEAPLILFRGRILLVVFYDSESPWAGKRAILEHTFPVLYWMKCHCGRILPFCIFCACKTHLEHPRITIYKPIRTEIWALEEAAPYFSLVRPVSPRGVVFVFLLKHHLHRSVPVFSLGIAVLFVSSDPVVRPAEINMVPFWGSVSRCNCYELQAEGNLNTKCNILYFVSPRPTWTLWKSEWRHPLRTSPTIWAYSLASFITTEYWHKFRKK